MVAFYSHTKNISNINGVHEKILYLCNIQINFEYYEPSIHIRIIDLFFDFAWFSYVEIEYQAKSFI